MEEFAFFCLRIIPLPFMIVYASFVLKCAPYYFILLKPSLFPKMDLLSNWCQPPFKNSKEIIAVVVSFQASNGYN